MLVSSLVLAALSLLHGARGAAIGAEPEPQPEILTIDLGEMIANMNMTAFEESIALEYGESDNTLEKRAEVVTCYNHGTKIDRKYAILAINDSEACRDSVSLSRKNVAPRRDARKPRDVC
ncbi:hypothetical protein CC1G_09971 [Coprinopsis cinerea okayama7|uniref:Uncharacterized protein n=1 Tax=Coprinopsis cinerea (strain Okayama-7 / 130 / ATCC MYA-4618 / FGSC 9003) TaxID=240176 RepID=A8PGT8_COPC7|nr:hypothetical protein CC1G_09971 [Coprinopsis cinerea okayama7\|eukprot:XP_001841279.1 hypothetical protein CC1G_09971 [Coprinopsis cinerea okayama7\